MKNIREQAEIFKTAQEYQSFEIGRTSVKKTSVEVEYIDEESKDESPIESSNSSGFVVALILIAITLYFFLK